MRPRGERGAALLTVLMFMTMIAVLTVAVMNVVQADVATGIRQQQAVQVFNMAEAGVHYAIAQLQQSGAATYTGETRTINDGSTTVGSATIAVRCLDGTLPTVNSCDGSNAVYRRITSTGSLALAGPVRVVTAIVEGTTSSTSHYAMCAYGGINFDRDAQVYGDVGSNASITLARSESPSKICNSVVGGACSGPASPPLQAYSGSAYAVGTITCGGGACNSTQIEGTIAPNQPTGSVCPPVTLTPPSSPGTTPLNVPGGSTVTLNPAVNYGAVTLASTGTGGSCPAVSLVATLIIDSGADPTATVTVRIRSLWLGTCSRLIITGVGRRVELWLLEPPDPATVYTPPTSAAHQALKAEQDTIFGSTTTGATPSGISGDRFTINVMSNKPTGDSGDCLNASDSTCGVVKFNRAGLMAGTFIAPSGGFEMNQSGLVAGSGAMLAQTISLDRHSQYYWDPRSPIGGGAASNFNRLKAWKDQ